MIEMIRSYVSKYGDPKTWPLTLQFQLLFGLFKNFRNDESICSIVMEHVHTILHNLAKIENSGVVEEVCDIRDKHFEDTLTCIWTCGKFRIRFDRENTYNMRSGIDTECYLTVTKKEI